MKKTMLLTGSSLALTLALVALALSTSAPPVLAAPVEQTASGYITVTVKTGDNLGKYARLYGVTGSALMAANPQLKDGNLIYPGQTITIPVVKTTTPSLTTPFYYTVVSGDTLTSIGRKFEMNGNVIANANGLADGNVVLGKTLLIPAGPHEHMAQTGETIKSIAAYYGVSVQHVLNSNNLPNPDVIYAGQPVYIFIVYNAKPVPLTGSGTVVPTATIKPGATATPVPTATPKPGTATPVPPSAGNYIQVTVKSGESLVTYVYRYGVRGSQIRAANPQLTDPNLLRPGDVVTIPVVASFTPSRTTPFFYIVQAGDTVASIAAKFEMDKNVLSANNAGASFSAGTTILLPAGPHLYVVKVGDDLKGIAAKYGTTVDFLLTGNNLPNPDFIYAPQEIFIPIQYNAAVKGYN
jgi:LysM repeat protein